MESKIPINQTNLINFACVDIDHDGDESVHAFWAHIFVKPYKEPMHLGIETKLVGCEWRVTINISHRIQEHDEGVVGMEEVTLNGEVYWFYILKKVIPTVNNKLASVRTKLKVRGQDPRRHNGTDHKP